MSTWFFFFFSKPGLGLISILFIGSEYYWTLTFLKYKSAPSNWMASCLCHLALTDFLTRCVGQDVEFRLWKQTGRSISKDEGCLTNVLACTISGQHSDYHLQWCSALSLGVIKWGCEDWYCSIITTGAGSWTSRQRPQKICSSSCRCSPGDAFHPAFCGTEHHLWDSPTLTKGIPAVWEKDQYQVRSNYLFAYLVLLQAVVTVYCKFKLWASVSVTAELSSNISRKRVLYMLLSHHCADRYWRLILEHWLVFYTLKSLSSLQVCCRWEVGQARWSEAFGDCPFPKQQKWDCL